MPVFGIDAYSPQEIAERVESYGVQRARMHPVSKFMLGVTGGGFICVGAMLQLLIQSDPTLNPGAARLLGSIAFATGYLIAISAGAAVFTTDNLQVMTWAARRISSMLLLRNWLVVLLANVVGSLGLIVILLFAGYAHNHGGATGELLLVTGADKAAESFSVAFFRGVMGNLLICMGVWLAMGGRSLTDRFIPPLLPIAAVPLASFEHSVGNLFYLQASLLLVWLEPQMLERAGAAPALWSAARNLIAVLAGNIVGGSVMVALMYHLIYRRYPVPS